MSTTPERSGARRSGEAPSCSFCDSRNMGLIMDFGEVALAGRLPEARPVRDGAEVPDAPVLLPRLLCGPGHRQGRPGSPVQELLLLLVRDRHAARALRRLRRPRWRRASSSRRAPPCVEFGCNDGVLLKPLADQGVRTRDRRRPGDQRAREHRRPAPDSVNDFFGEKVADRGRRRSTGRSTWSSPTMSSRTSPTSSGVTRAVEQVLKDDGVFVFEVHYLGKIVHGCSTT